MRVLLGVLFAAGSLVLGAVTACLTAINRARGADLDERQHWCETSLRRNELIEQQNAVDEWRLLYGEAEEPTEDLEEPQADTRIEH